MSNFDKNGIYFLPLGGADEIGMNMYVYAVDGKLIVVDAGYGFLNDDFPGMDLGYADPSFLENYAGDIEALFITHGHEDHFGAIAQIWPSLNCPVYATNFTLGLMKERLKEYKLDKVVPLNSVTDNMTAKLDNFEVEFVPIVHSVPETSALVIRTKYGNVVHATDWRFDDSQIELIQTDYKALGRVAADGVKMLVCDSTNVLIDEKQPSEYEVRESLLKLIPTFQNGLIATCFASNLMRLESLILAAAEAQRTPVLVGRTLLQNMKIAKDCGYFKNLPNVLDINEAREIPSDKVLYICTGSQGNYRSALSTIVNGESKDIKIGKGDTIIFSSKVIPGNEDKIERMQEKLIAQGVNVITDEDFLVHTSGHACQEELKHMYELLKPEIVMPVHGDKKFIRAHKRFAEECGIKEVACAKNGDVMLITGEEISCIEEVPTDILGVDRNQVTSLNSQLVKNRKRIMYNGSLFITTVFDAKWQLEDLQISSLDIMEEKAFDALADEIRGEIAKSLPEQLERLNYKENAVIDYIRGKIRKRIFNVTGIKPVVVMHFYKKPAVSE